MSVRKYHIYTTSTGGGDAAIKVETYIDDVLDSSVNMPYYDHMSWLVFDNLIQVKYNSPQLSWNVEILGDIENYNVGDVISWGYSERNDITLTENAPAPPPPPPPPGFDIELMNNQEELNKITKNPTLVRTLHGVLRDTTDLVDPEILIEFNGVLVDCNYMHISVFNRYYFINKIESVRTGLWKIYAHCDVLKTYAEGILGTEAVVARSENRYNLYLNDAMFKVYSNPRLQVANFPNKFTGESYVLIMNGAKYSST